MIELTTNFFAIQSTPKKWLGWVYCMAWLGSVAQSINSMYQLSTATSLEDVKAFGCSLVEFPVGEIGWMDEYFFAQVDYPGIWNWWKYIYIYYIYVLIYMIDFNGFQQKETPLESLMVSYGSTPTSSKPTTPFQSGFAIFKDTWKQLYSLAPHPLSWSHA